MAGAVAVGGVFFRAALSDAFAARHKAHPGIATVGPPRRQRASPMTDAILFRMAHTQ